MQIDTVLVDIETLIPDPNNERRHDEKNLKAIRNSLKQFGQVEPLIVRRQNNIVIGGNGRLEAMKAIGLTEAVIHYVDFDELKSKALRVALNRTSELASWDEAMLGNTLQELREHDFDLDELGFDISSLDGPVPTTDDDDDTVSEPIDKPLTLLISCKDEDEQQMLFLELRDRGFKVKA